MNQIERGKEIIKNASQMSIGRLNLTQEEQNITRLRNASQTKITRENLTQEQQDRVRQQDMQHHRTRR